MFISESLYEYFLEQWYKKYHEKKYIGNRHADKWIFKDMMDDLGYDAAVEVIDYYFKLGLHAHRADWLGYHYHELYLQLREIEQDKKFVDDIMRRTKRLAEGEDVNN